MKHVPITVPVRHPTPAEIKEAIFDALHDDLASFPMDGAAMPMPVRIYRLVNEAISKACAQ